MTSQQRTGVEIEATRALSPDHYGRLRIDDVYPTHKGGRGVLMFETVDEVKRAIAALQGILPVVDQLGDLVGE
jgi:hypothetical protein